MMRPASIIKKASQTKDVAQFNGTTLGTKSIANKNPSQGLYKEVAADKTNKTATLKSSKIAAGGSSKQSSALSTIQSQTSLQKKLSPTGQSKSSLETQKKQVNQAQTAQNFYKDDPNGHENSRISNNLDISDYVALSERKPKFDSESDDIEKLEAEAAAADAARLKTRQLIKEQFKLQHIDGRDSMDVGQHWNWKDEGEKENFSIFAQNKPAQYTQPFQTTKPESNHQKDNKSNRTKQSENYGQSVEVKTKQELIDQQNDDDMEMIDPIVEKIEVETKNKEITEIDQSQDANDFDFYKSEPKAEVKKDTNQLKNEQEDDEDNKLKELNDLLKNKKSQILKQKDAEDFEVFIKRISQQSQSETVLDNVYNEEQKDNLLPKDEPFQTEHSQIISHSKEEIPQQSQTKQKIKNIITKISPQKQQKQISHTQTNLDQISLKKAHVNGNATTDKYNELLTILDNVDNHLHSAAFETSDAQIDQSHSFNDFNLKLRNNGDGTAKYEPREAYQIAKEKMMELEIERDENKKNLDFVKQMREKEQIEFKKQLEMVKKQEAAQSEEIQNQLAENLADKLQMIEKLLNDKKAMQERLNELTGNVKDVESQAEKQKRVYEERLQVELKKNREAWVASEKVRKEKWEKERMLEIRETTVKGIEPEIQKMLQMHKDEKRQLEEKHVSEFKRRKEEMIEEFERKVEEMRTKLISDKEEALDKEREKSQVKIQEQYERLENQFNEERKRWKDTMQSEYERLESIRKKEKDTIEEQQKIITQRLEKELDRESQKWQDKLDEQKRRSQLELKNQKDHLRIEQEEWQNDYIKKQADDFKKQVSRMEEEMTRKRNREIEAIINKLGDETHMEQKNLLLQQEKKIKEVELRMKEQVELERLEVTQLKEKLRLESSSRHMLDENLQVLSRRVHDLELEVTDKKNIIRTLEQEKQSLNDKLQNIYGQQQTIREEIESQLRYKIEDKEREIRKIREEFSIKDHKYQSEVDQIKVSHQNELALIQEKVQSALGKKVNELAAMHEELKVREVKILKLKEMLEKQRKELLK